MAGQRANDSARDRPTNSASDDRSLHSWIAERNAEVAQRGRAEMAGRQAWNNSIRTGRDVHASNLSDIRSAGMRELSGSTAPTGSAHGFNPNEPRDDRGRWTTDTAAAAASHSGGQKAATISYGSLKSLAPSDRELSELRRQQRALANAVLEPDAQNIWLAIPALAALAALGGIEEAGAWAAEGAFPELEQAPLDLLERDPYRRVGDNWATRKGRQAHAELKAKVKSKDGWDPEPPLDRPGKSPLRPDAGTPKRNPPNADNADERYYLELKPNTPTGRIAAARAVKRYKGLTTDKVRAVFYDPKKIK